MGDPLDRFLAALEEGWAAERRAREKSLQAERQAFEERLERGLAAQRQELEAERQARQKAIGEMLQAERQARQEADERLEEWMKRVVGDFGDREGPMWESIASPYVMAHLEATDGLTWVEPLENRYLAEANKEFDLFGKARKNGKTFVVVGEVKRTLESKDVREFEGRIGNLQHLRGRHLIKVLFAGKTTGAAKDLARGKRIRLFVHRLDGRRRHAR